MRIGIVQFPGSNCERETILAVKRAGMEPQEFLWNEAYEKLHEMSGFIIVGGFSYEDRSRAGIIAALDPVMNIIKAESELGKPVLGICNGAQILVEAGLVPGLQDNKVGLALTENKRMVNDKMMGTGYYNAWVNMRLSDHYQRNAFTRHLNPKQILRIPIAHAEGRFVMTDALLAEVREQGLNLFQYCDDKGEINAHFPINPNGSIDNIAAISNKAGNVLAMMPHPERTERGDAIFRSMRDYIAENDFQNIEPLFYYPRPKALTSFKPQGQEYLIEAMITDNQALTVQKTLQQLGFPLKVKRFIHWEIHSHSSIDINLLKSTGVLWNDRKEHAVESFTKRSESSFLVRAIEDLTGQKALQTLKYHFNIQSLNAIRHGILWHFELNPGMIPELKTLISKTQIISNPYAHDCYQYS